MKRPCKIAVAGTHSTGKTTFISRLQTELAKCGIEAAYVHDSAQEAREIGFPILKEYTFESTAWLISQAIGLEARAALNTNVILVDRPVPDALGYLIAALRTTRRALEPGKLERLEAICAAWVDEYDLIFVTALDTTLPIGPCRDDDHAFRVAAGKAIADILDRLAPDHRTLRPDNVEESLELAARVAAAAI